MFHHWNPMSMGTRGADEVGQWFAEGFTVYYAGVIPLRSGLTAYSEYLDYLNRWLRRYELSPLRDMKEAAWKSISHSSGEGYGSTQEVFSKPMARGSPMRTGTRFCGSFRAGLRANGIWESSRMVAGFISRWTSEMSSIERPSSAGKCRMEQRSFD